MKKLLTRFLLYAVTIAFLYSVYLFMIVMVMNTDRLYKIQDNKSVLILGDSRLAYGINDSSLDDAYNLSQVADAYLYSYQKLQKILPLNPNIHTVVLAYAGENIQQKMVDVWLYKNTFMYEKVHNYLHLMTPGQLLYMFAHNPAQVIKVLVGTPKSKTPLCARILRSQSVSMQELHIGEHEYLGGVINLKKNIDFIAKDKDDPLKVSQWQIDYLHKIVNLCRSHNVRVVFLRTPEHKLFKRPNENLYLNILHEQFPDVVFKDYVGMNLPDSCFYDWDHINHNGAVALTDSLRSFFKTR